MIYPEWIVPPPRPPQFPPPTQFPDNPELQAALLELQKRDKDFTALSQFAQSYIEVIPAKHHQLICDAVDDTVFHDKYDVLVVMSPPASAKSTYISVAAPAYIIGRDPKARIISVSRAADMATAFGGRVKNIVDSAPFGTATGVSISRDTRAKDEWTTTAGGGYFAVGASGGVLGRRADIVICDDIHASFEDAQSETQLQKIRQWFEGDLLSRLTPTGKLIVIGQRLNPNDIIGFILKRAIENPRIRMKVLKFTAICDDPSNDPLGRSHGERMWPEFYTDDYLHDKRQDDFIWRTLWMQEPPSDSGSWVNTEDIQFRPSPIITDTSSIYGMTDLALSVNSGDYTVHFLVAVNAQGEWDILEGVRERVDPEVSSTKLVKLCSKYKPKEWLIDDDNASKVFMTLVATKARQLGIPVPWKPMKMRGQDKETRATALWGQFKRRKIFMPADSPFAGWLTKELLIFPNGIGSGVDDGIDALGLMGRRLPQLAVPSGALAPNPFSFSFNKGYSLNDLWDTAPKQSSLRI